MNNQMFAVGEIGNDCVLGSVSLRQNEISLATTTRYQISDIASSDKWRIQTAHCNECTKWEIWSPDLNKVAEYPAIRTTS
jgi:hypothetical protein